MKFRFCGDLDAPDWILKEITILSKIPNIRVRLLCGQVINSIFGEALDYDKIEKLVKDANFELSDIKATIAALHFIINNAAKYDVDDAALSTELQQLGLPKEHCDALARPYRDNKDKLRDHGKANILKLPQLESVDWRVDYLLSSSKLANLNAPAVQMKFTVKDDDGVTPHAFEVPADKFLVLYYELKAAQSLMESMQI